MSRGVGHVALSLALLPFLLTLGCATAEREQIPTYPLMDIEPSLEIIRARMAGVESISGEGTITLIDAKNDPVRLDAAFVFAPPDRARVRAWKFGQAVLDLTVTPDGTWLFLPRGQDGHAEQLQSASKETGEAIRQWLRLLSAEFSAVDWAGGKGDELIVSMPGWVRCEIHRATLTPRRYTLRPIGHPLDDPIFTLALGRYQSVGKTVWPTRIDAVSDTGHIVIEMRNPELNAAPPGAFKPPARAVKVP